MVRLAPGSYIYDIRQNVPGDLAIENTDVTYIEQIVNGVGVQR